METKIQKIIVTHDSGFHSDDVFAVATVLLVLEKKGEEGIIVRSRDEDVISKADFVVDVGRIYNEENEKFDHHQIGGAGVRENSIPYASFGLVWKKYGEVLCGDSDVQKIMDKSLVQFIDALDNGINLFENKLKGNIYPYTVKSIISSFLPTWKENGDMDSLFKEAVQFAKKLLSREIKINIDNKQARERIDEAYNNTEDERLLILDNEYDFQGYVPKFPKLLFVIYPSRQGTWKLETVRKEANLFNFEARKNLPSNWAGKVNEELEKETGVEGAIFCHNALFVIRAKTKEAILELAKKALEK